MPSQLCAHQTKHIMAKRYYTLGENLATHHDAASARFLKDRQSPIAQNVQEAESTLDDKNRSKDSIYDAHR